MEPKKFKFEMGQMESDNKGFYYRPYLIDGKVIHRICLQKLMEDEARNETTEVDSLLDTIEKITGKRLTFDQLIAAKRKIGEIGYANI